MGVLTQVDRSTGKRPEPSRHVGRTLDREKVEAIGISWRCREAEWALAGSSDREAVPGKTDREHKTHIFNGARAVRLRAPYPSGLTVPGHASVHVFL